MFEWLKDEMDRIKTRKFHVVDSPLSDEQRELVEQSDLPVPPSYKEFVIQFGGAQLYRQGSIYLVQIFNVPTDAQSDDGRVLLHFGRTDMALAYFRESLFVPGEESPVFEWQHELGLQQTASCFEEWLRARCSAARKLFSKKEWAAIEAGSPPFTEQEQAIVESRRKFRWQVIGIADNGNLMFEVHNGSNMVLPFLSIGVRAKDGKLNGGVWLPVSSVRPGQTCIIEKDCYKNLLLPKEVDIFEKPDPEPEDRDRYWEFRRLS
ncbi:MAG: SMI1/KNR4 family protein [Microcoleus sp. PH2017_25_DOB_D_A]|uniref:hypothetical protein n=1 Tax=unclassified Microcoleus TaxID=2642155 RepID=UPI001DDEF82D|nr:MULTISPECIES: hypothetical protein [unclassified Microcoleus]MCC3421987.1 SMI1/KNR4 family protein [Microcoleus sp. PH2017_07_MST_O_A]MCC3513703.1 SMI1/KNR4 family protein [Microcoleus sp. PH2017_17_BER_D_A]TAE40440.1 MAG: hypothetical protein EAZ90_20380 [Oscillatoriales cyanobacterium]MCC3499315.1 SMI1/KNR4 family protein [Microcoleus sp. PH2017_15_JOR_U_A]MCC3535540.1 SMI1/KNR4 family protein [Microcoleus sp. PH2017_25_DOB_D_A]